MEIHIRNARLDEYKRVETIMKQVQQMHIDWRPDIYKYSQTVLPLEVYEQAVNDKTFFVYHNILFMYCQPAWKNYTVSLVI